jgi:hypothetical protein
MGRRRLKIELYLDSAKGWTYNPDPHYGSRVSNVVTGHGPSTGHWVGKQFGVRLSPGEKELVLIDVLGRAAALEGAKLRVYDVSRFWHAARAYLTGVRDIPAVRIGNLLVRTGDLGAVTAEQLAGALEREIERELERG